MDDLAGAEDYGAWIGRSMAAEDILTSARIAAFRATLDRETCEAREGEAAPQGIHWTLAPPLSPMRDLGPDGHPARGGFMPPVPLPRRMWASSAVEFLRPLHAGERVARTSTVASVTSKQGSIGPLVFVEVEHVTSCEGVAAIRERQTIVFRGEDAGPKASEAPQSRSFRPDESWTWRRELTPDPVLLFRYSALTFNGHRIHYDRPYATEVEGYPDLVVHGPLTATLLLDLCARQLGENRLASFSFRGRSPAFVGRTLHLVGRMDGQAVELAALGEDGRVVMSGRAVVAAG